MLKQLYSLYFLVGILLILASIINFAIQNVLTGLMYLPGAIIFVLLGYMNKSNEKT